jgi:hypothetical protein
VSDTRRVGHGRLAAFVLVFLALNLAFGAVSALGGGRVLASLLTPSLDVTLLVLVLCLFAWLRLPGGRLLPALLSALGLFLLAFRAADVLVPVFFDRPLALHSDLTYIPDLFALLRDTSSPWLFYPGAVLLAAILLAAGYGLYRALRVLQRAVAGLPYRCATVGLAGALAVFLLVGLVPAERSTVLPRAAHEIAGLVRRGAYLEEQRRYFETRGREVAALAGESSTLQGESSTPKAESSTLQGESSTSKAESSTLQPGAGTRAPAGVAGPSGTGPLGLLRGRDVLLFVVESYGYTLYSEPGHFQPIEASLREYEEALHRGGYAVVSAFLTSTAFGGNSWLADSTLATGLKIDNQSSYELLLKSEAKPIARYFNEAGYRTVVAMPATTSSWPEGDYFGFEKKYYFRDFGYRGPNLKWAPMTDQYVLEVIHRREVAAAERPLFVQYVLISSHYPFNLIPRYFEDWSMVGDGSIYGREGSVTVLPIEPGGNTAGAKGYVAAMHYELRLLTDYLTRYLKRDTLVVILGDHQPYSGITGRGKPWSVPIHIVSRDRRLLEPFRLRGYTDGWIPRQPLPHPGLETFLPGLIEDFSVGSGRAVPDPIHPGGRVGEAAVPEDPALGRAPPGGLADLPGDDAS